MLNGNGVSVFNCSHRDALNASTSARERSDLKRDALNAPTSARVRSDLKFLKVESFFLHLITLRDYETDEIDIMYLTSA